MEYQRGDMVYVEHPPPDGATWGLVVRTRVHDGRHQVQVLVGRDRVCWLDSTHVCRDKPGQTATRHAHPLRTRRASRGRSRS